MRIALVGFGKHVAETLLPVIRTMTADRIAFVARAPRQASILQQLGLIQYESIEAMIEQSRPTHVIVAANRHVNGVCLRRVIEAGVPRVFVEKPPATSTEELSQLIELERRCSAQVAVGMNYRFATLLEDLRASAAEHGGIVDVDVLFQCAPIVDSDQSAVLHRDLTEFGIHGIDLLTALTEAEKVLPVMCRAVGKGTYSNFTANASQRTGTLRVGTYGRFFCSTVRLLCSDGTFFALDDFENLEVIEPNAPAPLRTTAKARVHVRLPSRKLALDKAGYRPMLQHFLADRQSVSLRELVPTFRAIDDAVSLASLPTPLSQAPR